MLEQKLAQDLKPGKSRREAERERGAQLAEYVLMAVLIAFIAMVGIRFYGQRQSKQFSNIGKTVNDVMP
jgi:Flp pilus assembly pilin Flp